MRVFFGHLKRSHISSWSPRGATDRGYHKWISFQLAAIENARTLDVVAGVGLRLGDTNRAPVADENDSLAPTAQGIKRALFLHSRHFIAGKVQPLANVYRAVSRLMIRSAFL